MGRAKHPLTARTVETIKPSPKHFRRGDGGGLYLNVLPSGAKSWVFIYTRAGKTKEMGLGPARDVTLAEAREIAARHRRAILAGIDPLEARRGAASKPTFGAFAATHIATMESAWRNPKHRQQWRNTLDTYAGAIMAAPVDAITTKDVLELLRPIWSTKTETASRVRGRIEAILDAAKAAGYRCGDNPAAWRGNLDQLLPKRTKLSRGHHAAMPIDDVPGFMGALREAAGISPRALEFAVLTAARTGEVLGAQWSEVDLQAMVWTIPASRMKAAREHRVPLSDRAAAILTEMAAVRVSGFVFPGSKRDAGLSGMALDMTLRRLGEDCTVHGFRSTFRDWASERTDTPHEVAEMALAHAIVDKTEAAYRRGDLFAKRVDLMGKWASFIWCTPAQMCAL